MTKPQPTSKDKEPMETDLYCNCTNLFSVIERGEEYEAD